MESVPAAPAVPAQSVAVAPPAPMQSAAEAAISKSPTEYRAARQAERAGKPLPDVPVATPASSEDVKAAPAAAPAQPQLSKRQIEINERASRAVEAATTTLREENARLTRELAAKASAPAQPQVAAPAAAEPPAPPVVEKFQSLQAWSEENPTKTIEDYMDERAAFNTAQTAKAAHVEEQFKRQAEDLTKRGQAFATRWQEAKAAEPDLASKIPPALADTSRDTRPLSAFSAAELSKATFTNVVAEALFRSDRPAELAKHLHAHQDDAIRIAGLDGPVEQLIALAVLDGRLSSSTPAARATTAPASPKPKTLTDAPAPLETLGTRPAEAVDAETAAIKRGDTRSFRQIRREQRASNLVRLR